MPPKPPARVPRPPKAPRPSYPQASAPRPPRANPTTAPPPHPATSQPHASPRPPPPPPPPRLPRAVTSTLSIAFFSFCAALLFRDNVLTIDTVTGSSMAPTLSPSYHETGARDRLILQRGILARRALRRGDVVTFYKPHKRHEVSVKRVVGVEGDTVYPARGYACDPGVVGMRRVEGWDGLGTREWSVGGEYLGARGEGEVQVGKVVVPRGHVWVEGDNWRGSFDSCDFGPVSLGLVDGRAVGVWREWWRVREVGDGRKEGERAHRSRVVEGEGRVSSMLDVHFRE